MHVQLAESFCGGVKINGRGSRYESPNAACAARPSARLRLAAPVLVIEAMHSCDQMHLPNPKKIDRVEPRVFSALRQKLAERCTGLEFANGTLLPISMSAVTVGYGCSPVASVI